MDSVPVMKLARDLSAGLGLAQALGEDAGGQVTLHAGVVGLHLVAALLDGLRNSRVIWREG